MNQTSEWTTAASPESGADLLPRLLEGYRFRVCEDATAAGRALAVRRQVYVDGVGYHVPVPDAYDERSWFLLAEETRTGTAVGSMRLTPRFTGALELEESFALPARLRGTKSVELNRFAILPGHRKGKTFLPVVSLGLFKLVHAFLQGLDAHYMIIAAKPERVWTYEWMRFARTGRTGRYGQLDGAEHELLWYDFRHRATILEGHPFQSFFLDLDYHEVRLPAALPPLGLGVDLARGSGLQEVA